MDTIEDVIRRIIREELAELELQRPVDVVHIAPEARTWLTTGEAAERVRWHPVTITRALQLGELHGVQAGRNGHWRMRPACVGAWLTGAGCEHA